MVDGSIYTVYKKCGNKNCRCAKGELHGPFKYLSKKVDGKTKLRACNKIKFTFHPVLLISLALVKWCNSIVGLHHDNVY